MRAEKTKGVNGGICFLKTISGHINKHPACVSRQQSGEHKVVSKAVGNHQKRQVKERNHAGFKRTE